jgi:drug/metabolite transporter (DMT)-like permease
MLLHKNPKSVFRLIGAAVVAVIGGIICAWKSAESSQSLFGILLVQISNVFFAAGTLIWKRTNADSGSKTTALMFPYFVGASTFSGLAALAMQAHLQDLTNQQILVILWLAVVASGLGFSFWNHGAGVVSPNRLTVANNLKLPIAIVISLTIFSETANLVTLCVGISLITLALTLADEPHKAK